ncbi:uncharacterized protein DUF4349 [Ulvibacter sp. MAR_2010_11]|uniref:DUF4349 domain-containing protein n=1 Tax=Ulvibacter sp. MAR_2010_11 TaxID=1250229 RepID=UPI000C2C6C87|nr:DUF4349 domain-containing protein [Ulvibacter sp. MAR_2010_11]PKA82953.1 uncharacterized protein DUF4349 [Ulvibacter sp. MAR_2010_11]
MKLFSSILFLFFLACGGPASDNGVMVADEEMAGYKLEPEMASMDGVLQSIDGSESTEIQEQKIIKTANLVFETQKPEETHQKILQLAQQYKGTVQNDNSGKGYNRLFRNLTVRVPTESFHNFIAGVSEGVDYFDQREISQQDVSEEFVDLEARLKAKRELEKRYLELLSQAKSVKDMLEIERELSNIREEIEAKQGRLQFLQNRVSMSTVTIEFYKITSETGITQSYGQKMKNAFQGGWDGISVFFLGLLYLWPLFLLIGIAILVIRWIIRRRKKK